jgi:hypothetical protein
VTIDWAWEISTEACGTDRCEFRIRGYALADAQAVLRESLAPPDE